LFRALPRVRRHARAQQPPHREQTLAAFIAEARVGDLPCPDLTVDHLEAWLRTKKWSASTARTKINHVMAALNYCVRRKKILENPLHGVAKPRWERRRRVIDAEDERRIYDAATGPFRAILTVLRLTGARPSELCNARVEHYEGGVIKLAEHKTDDSGEPRIIYLTGEARKVVEGLIGGRSCGPIFRNAAGNTWTPDSLYCRFKRLRGKLGLGEGVFPYAIRHRFASDGINNGNANPALIAKALGHADLNMLLKHYLREDPEAVRRALEEVTRA
jgi:integrase